MIVKRIIAMEGDEVRTRKPYPFPTEIVPQGHVWVEGEHPEERMSLDSNTYGPVGDSDGLLESCNMLRSLHAGIEESNSRKSPRSGMAIG